MALAHHADLEFTAGDDFDVGATLLRGDGSEFLNLVVVSRPLKGEPPTIDLFLGYHKANNSPLLRTFLSRVDEMVRHVSKNSGKLYGADAH